MEAQVSIKLKLWAVAFFAALSYTYINQLTNGVNNMQVIQMHSPKSYNPVANQYKIHDNFGNTFFQSYRSLIAKITATGQIFLDKNYWDYSRTTGKYRNIFLSETMAETKKRIKSGEYKLVDLQNQLKSLEEPELKARYFDKWKQEEADKEEAFRNERYAERLKVNGYRD